MLATVAWEASLTTHATILAASISYAIGRMKLVSTDQISLHCRWADQWCSCRQNSTDSAFSRLEDGNTSKHATSFTTQEREWTLEHELWKIDKTNYHFVSETLRTIFTELDLSDRAALRLFISRNAKPYLGQKIGKCKSDFIFRSDCFQHM